MAAPRCPVRRQLAGDARVTRLPAGRSSTTGSRRPFASPTTTRRSRSSTRSPASRTARITTRTWRPLQPLRGRLVDARRRRRHAATTASARRRSSDFAGVKRTARRVALPPGLRPGSRSRVGVVAATAGISRCGSAPTELARLRAEGPLRDARLRRPVRVARIAGGGVDRGGAAAPDAGLPLRRVQGKADRRQRHADRRRRRARPVARRGTRRPLDRRRRGEDCRFVLVANKSDLPGLRRAARAPRAATRARLRGRAAVREARRRAAAAVAAPASTRC